MKIETRVYVVDANEIYKTLSTEEIQDIAERSGDVYSLSGFQEAFNCGEIQSENVFIFFVEVVTND